jgi:spore coat protein A
MTAVQKRRASGAKTFRPQREPAREFCVRRRLHRLLGFGERTYALGVGVLVAAALSAHAHNARAETVSLGAAMDTTIYEENPSSSNGAGAYIFAGANDDGAARRALLVFNVGAAVPPGSTIQSAELRLVLTRTKLGDNTVELHRLTAAWGEGSSNAPGNEGGGAPAAQSDATWSHRRWPDTPWATPGGDFDPAVSASTVVSDTSAIYSWSAPAMAADVQGWLSDPTRNFGWILIGTSSESASSKRFGSRNGGGAASPELIVVFSPPAKPIGACCAADGSCGFVLDPGAACAGHYQGTGSSCDPDVCPPPVAVCCELSAAASCSMKTKADCAASLGGWHEDEPTCAPNPCTAVLTPFVDPLPLPAVATPVANGAAGLQYRLAMVERRQKLHRDLPPTTVWGFDDGVTGGGTPGPTLEARAGVPIRVTWANDLRDAAGNLRTAHVLPVDTCVDGASTNAPRTVVHLHGGHVPAESDGSPEATFLPGQEVSYDYPNNQPAATLWYHDHAMGITRLNVLMGLAGFYILRDDAEDAPGLPSGKYEIPLVIQDRSFHPDGSFSYPDMWMEHFFGDTVLVNGKVWPYLQVDRGVYRFRVLNGSNSRTYTLMFSPFLWFVQIGSDGGLLPGGVAKSTVTIAPGERADLIVDFSSLGAGQEAVLLNTAAAPYPSGDDANRVANVMKFVATDAPGPVRQVYVNLRSIDRLDPETAATSRDFLLDRADDPCGGGTWRINELGYDDVTEMPRLGTTEIWRFINRSGEAHPMHLHLVQFQVLDRQPFVIKDDDVVLTGTPTTPDLEELGWKDTVLAPPFQVTRIIARFEDYVGRFPYHCHTLEHEDHAMMRQFETLPPCGDGGCPADGSADGPPLGPEALGPGGCQCGAAASGGRDPIWASALASGLAVLVAARRRGRKRGSWGAVALAVGLFVAGAVSGCSSGPAGPSAALDDGGTADQRAPAPDGQAGLPFGASCTDGPSCASGFCALFGDGSMHCSVSCANGETCPVGSQGSKCNGKGFCAY